MEDILNLQIPFQMCWCSKSNNIMAALGLFLEPLITHLLQGLYQITGPTTQVEEQVLYIMLVHQDLLTLRV